MEALVIKKSQFDADLFHTASMNASMFNMNLVHEMGKSFACLVIRSGVAGDTFRVCSAYSGKLVYPEFFKANPDYKNPDHRTKYGELRKSQNLLIFNVNDCHFEPS